MDIEYDYRNLPIRLIYGKYPSGECEYPDTVLNLYNYAGQKVMQVRCWRWRNDVEPFDCQTLSSKHYYVTAGGRTILEYQDDNSASNSTPAINIYGLGRRLQQWAWDILSWSYQRRTFLDDGHGSAASVLAPNGSALAHQ